MVIGPDDRFFQNSKYEAKTQMKSSVFKEWNIRIALILLSFLFGAFSTHQLQSSQSSNTTYQHLLEAAYYYVKTIYVEPVDDKKLWDGAIRGLLEATGDPYTRFLDPEEHAEFNNAEKGKKAGIGVELTIRGGYPIVISPVSGSPAEKAGIEPGDIITSIDKHETYNVPFGEMVKNIAGETGSVVELEIRRKDEEDPITVYVTRGFFQLDYVAAHFFEKEKLGYIRLSHFFGEDTGSVNEFRDDLKDFVSRDVRGIIVDLRNNSGGHLNMAATLAGYFLKEGQVVVTAKGRDESQNRTVFATGETGIVPDDVKVVVLINGGSASASEIMAGALHDHKRATLLGTVSFGKASVQQVVRPLPGDAALLVTIQKYYTPNNISIHGKGIKPDVPVDDIEPDRDERYYLSKMKDDMFLQDFKKRYPTYNDGLLQQFQEELKAKGWNFRPEISRILIKKSYPDSLSEKIDPEMDIQLARALELLGGESH